MIRSTLVVAFLLSLATPASAQNCKKGIPCGNSCISAGKTCRVGAGTARAAPGSPGATAPVAAPPPSTTTSRVPTSTAVVVPPGSTFVALAGGFVFYSIDPSCIVWREMPPADLQWFRTEADAIQARFRRSMVLGC